MKMKKITLLALVLALVFTSAGCGGTAPPVDSGFTASVGETLDTTLVSFTVTDFSLSDEPVEGLTLAEDHQFLYVTVKVANGTREEIPVYFDDFELAIGEEKRFPEFPVGEGLLAEETMLRPRKDMSGDLLFVIPKKTKEVYLMYDEYFTGDVKGDSYAVHISL